MHVLNALLPIWILIASSPTVGGIWGISLPSFSDIYNGIKKLTDPLSALMDGIVNSAQDFVKHKARISQAKYFLGDTFASRMDTHLKAQNTSELPSLVEYIDASPDWKEKTDAIADTVVQKGVISLQASAVGYFGGPVGELVQEIITNPEYLWYLHRIGDMLAFYYFPVGAMNTLVVVALRYASENPQVVQQVFGNLCTVTRTAAVNLRNNAVYVADELTAENLPSAILDEYILRNLASLKKAKWAHRAIKKIMKFNEDAFIDYFFVVLRHFPTCAYGRGNIASKLAGTKGINIVQKALLYCSSIVGVLDAPSELKWKQQFLKELSSRPVEHDTYIAVELYLEHLGSLDTIPAWDDSAERLDLFKSLAFIDAVLLSTKEAVAYVIERGLYCLSALAVLMPPASDPDWDAYKVITYAMQKGTPASMLATLKYASLPPSFAWSSLAKYVQEARRDGEDRSQELVYSAFLSLLDTPSLVHSICRPLQFQDVSSTAVELPLTMLALNLSFLRERQDSGRPLTSKEMLQVANAITNLKFGIPIHISGRIKKAGLSLTETINKILKEYCGFTANPSIVVTSTEASTDEMAAKQSLPSLLREADVWQAPRVESGKSMMPREERPYLLKPTI